MFPRRMERASGSSASIPQANGSVPLGTSCGSLDRLFMPTFSPTHLVPCLSSSSQMNFLSLYKSTSAIPVTFSGGCVFSEQIFLSAGLISKEKNYLSVGFFTREKNFCTQDLVHFNVA